jgi:hypothetical protein
MTSIRIQKIILITEACIVEIGGHTNMKAKQNIDIHVEKVYRL